MINRAGNEFYNNVASYLYTKVKGMRTGWGAGMAGRRTAYSTTPYISQ